MVDVVTHMPEPQFANQVALITGAASGIGRAVAEAFLKLGCRVAVVDINEAGLRSIELSAPDCVVSLVLDATQEQAGQHAARSVVERWGRIDILVNNVGGRIGSPDLDVSRADWEATLSLCLTSHFLWSQSVVPCMIERNYGRIINISSNAGVYRSNTGGSGISYSAAKGGVCQLTRSLAHCLGRYRINVNAVAPGSILTEAGIKEKSELDPQLLDRLMRETALNYFAPPEEIASIVVFLASRDASYVTGTTILANGGWCTS
jgi:NAD(P)-dependent dehydrogenase (short-subunit alcohol dehydrogenase family)